MSSSLAGYPVLYLDQWEGITPVLLPVGPLTLSCINLATVGVAIPFFFFLVSMFYLLMPIWLGNFHSDKAMNQMTSSSRIPQSDVSQASDSELGTFMYGSSKATPLQEYGQEDDLMSRLKTGSNRRIFN